MLAFINSDIIASESGGCFFGGRANILLITALPNSSCIWNNSILGTYRGRKRENSFFQATHLSPSLPIGPPTLEQTVMWPLLLLSLLLLISNSQTRLLEVLEEGSAGGEKEAILMEGWTPGTPCFIAFCFTGLHRCCVFLQTEGKTLHLQKDMTHFIVILSLLRTQSAVSPRYACTGK